MDMKLRALIVTAVLAAALGNVSIAEAKKIRNPIERRQHPGRGFWEADHESQKPAAWQKRHFFQHHWKPFWMTPKKAAPAKKKSWGWQRSSRAELHHPGTRRTR